MITFREFLLEARKNKEFSLNDSKGKLYEILMGSHLHHGSKTNGNPNNFLDHYRDETGKSPKEVHDYIKGELDKRHPGKYNEINGHSRAAAEHVRNELAKLGHKTIKRAAWTSQKADHKNFTGVADPNSDADVMLETNKGHLGLSLKYAESKDANLRNNGLDSLEKMAALKKDELGGIREKHYNEVRNGAGIQTHDEYKAKKESTNKLDQAAVARAEASALNAQRSMAAKISDGLRKKYKENGDQEGLHNYVKERIAPQTKFQHFRIQTRPLNNGSVEHKMGDIQDDRKKLHDFEHLRVKPHDGTSITSAIEGRRKGQKTYEPVLTQSIKKGSGPLKGFASSTKAPFLSKEEKVVDNSLKPPKPTLKSMPVKPTPKASAPILKTVKKNTKKPLGNDGTVGGAVF